MEPRDEDDGQENGSEADSSGDESNRELTRYGAVALNFDNGSQAQASIDTEEEEDEDSGAETHRIGSSVMRFARRCVKSGEFSKAISALMKIIEISDLTSIPCRQALFFVAQIFSVTGQGDLSLEFLMEVWDKMPPPYYAQDAQLLLMVVHERLERPRFTMFWYKKAFGSYPAPTAVAFDAWLGLANKSFDEGDFIVAKEAFSRAFAYIFEAQRWPSDLKVFRFVDRFLAALVSVTSLQGDIRFHRQQVAFSLALTLLDLIDESHLADCAFDGDYLSLRRTYALHFPSVYEYLFKEEDQFIGRISRAWRLFRTRRSRRQELLDHQRQRQENVVDESLSRVLARKKKPQQRKLKLIAKLAEPSTDPHELQVQQIREKTRARILAQRAARETRAISPQLHGHQPAQSPQTQSPQMVKSPTRRKIETVKQLREKNESCEEKLPLQSTNQRPSSPDHSYSSSLLEVYDFPPLTTHHRQFEPDAGRAPDLGDSLEEIEAFARMAHYRSRVLVHQHQPLRDPHQIDMDKATPLWLRQLNGTILFIETHQSRRPFPIAPAAASKSHFSEIHARVVAQLKQIHAKYVLQHGKTVFTTGLSRFTKQIETWQFNSIENEVLQGLRSVKAEAEREEGHRNLEFYHALQLKK